MKNKYFYINIDKETIISILGALLMLVFSFAMKLFPDKGVAFIVLRDVLMIFLLGFCFPLYFICIKQKKSLSILGIHRKKLGVSLIISIILTGLLLALFVFKQQSPISLSLNIFFAITYIFAAGVFEMVFIYGFLRYEFEKAFGIIPAIVLTAIFYSFHHAGFQPEFLKLFFVGIMYVSVFYITKNIFIIFPFFWGVGAIWDVLVNSTAGNQIKNTPSFLIAISLLAAMIITSMWVYYRKHIEKK